MHIYIHSVSWGGSCAFINQDTQDQVGNRRWAIRAMFDCIKLEFIKDHITVKGWSDLVCCLRNTYWMLNRSTPTPARLRCSSGVRLTIGESEKLTGVWSALYGGTGRRATRIYNMKAAKQEPEWSACTWWTGGDLLGWHEQMPGCVDEYMSFTFIGSVLGFCT